MNLTLFDESYNPKNTEDKIYKMWEKSGFANPDNLPGKRNKKFSVMMAPPNITGSLHMGHALENISVDILVRMKRMKGFKTLWIPGIDHAGIATQNVVEKELRKENLTRRDLGREKFIGRVKDWKEKYGTVILEQLKKIGALPDWSRTRYTMDSDYSHAVLEAFNHYYKKGWIYRGERVINWCIRCATSISDLEINYVAEKAKLYFIKYGPFTLATVRPETKIGDTALAVNPSDLRYKKYVGEYLEIESIDNNVPFNQPAKAKKIKIKVVADQAVDQKFGTGIIKVTPAHDITDSEIAERHNLPSITIIDEHGRMNENAGLRYQGMKTAQAREHIVKDLEAIGLIEKIEDYEHNITRCDRCNSIIEPLPSKQWFLKMKELSKLAISSVKSKKTIIYPKRWEHVLIDRLKNERDWNISRQLWWGHTIPLDGETDVLDTWFSSALWPFATLGWPENTKDLKTYYPTDYITSAREILNIWIAKMIFSGLEFTKKTPFKVAHIHATMLTKDGKRMSKSLGTGIDPLILVNTYGADALRFGLIYQNLGNQDIRFSEDPMLTGKKFCNKIWNASRFVLNAQNGISNFKFLISKQSQNSKPQTEADRKILNSLKKTVKEVDNLMEKYEFGKALHALYDFFWHDFCDTYIEKSKEQVSDTRFAVKTRNILLNVLSDSLKMLHPFLPFITEEIWGVYNEKKLLMVENWPK